MYDDGRIFGLAAYQMVEEVVKALRPADDNQPELEAAPEAVQAVQPEAKGNLLQSLRGLMQRGQQEQTDVCAPAVKVR